MVEREYLNVLDASGCFDPDWYRSQYPDVDRLGMDPLEHFLWIGAKLGRDPSASLTASNFLEQFPGVLKLDALHYRAADSAKVAASRTAPPNWSETRLTVLQLTPPKPRNPFYTMINEELVRRGVKLHYTIDRNEALQTARRTKSLVVHVHQLEPLYHPGERTIDAVAARAESLLAFLRDLKETSAKLIWTKHNPQPHNTEFSKVDIKIEREALALADKVVVLSKGAAAELAGHPGQVAHVPHPEFESYYGRKVARADARRSLDLPADAFIFACVGELKPYIRHLVQIEAFREFCARYKGEKKPMLLFVGNPGPPDYVTSLTHYADGHIRVVPKDIPNDRMRYWMSAIDASLFAFERIWVSGSVLLSLSYGVPAIVPDIGYLDEYVSHENTGYFYEPNQVTGMIEAMLEAANTPYRAHIEYMCSVFREKYALASVAERYRDVFFDVLEGPPL